MQPLFEYSGIGKLLTDKEAVDNCDFTLIQAKNGDIRLSCQKINSPLAFIEDTERFISFDGTTSDGVTISVLGEFIRTNISSTFGEGANGSATYTASGRSIAKAKFSDDEIAEVRFGVNNFEFVGEYSEQISPTRLRVNHLKLAFDGIELTVRQLDDYDERLKVMNASKDTDVTCEFIYRVSMEKIDEIIEITDRLCNLLSIAKGKRVNWIYYNTNDINNQPVYIEHQHRITSDFTGFELIDEVPRGQIVDYLNKCYPNYKMLDSSFHFLNIANTIVDIRSRGFLETRCLVIYSLMEYLVRKAGCKGEFGPKIKQAVRKYKVPATNGEIRNFVKSRNSLVHEMKFVSSNPLKEYQDSLHLLDKLILRILGYDSWYINAADMPKWTGEQKHELKPTP